MRNASPTTQPGSIAKGYAARAIAEALADLGFEVPEIEPRPLPFAGTWGVASSVCRAVAGDSVARELEQSGALAGLSKREAKRRIAESASARAQALAEQVAARIASRSEIARTEAVNGYVNVHFGAAAAAHLIQDVLDAGSAYGRAAPRSERVMVEHSQPNTHKAFHVGHLRNVALGVAVSNIIAAAGYPLLQATYPGDIGMHVIKCLWCYERFHRGEEPASPEARGRWLGEIYAESDARLNYRQEVMAFLSSLGTEHTTFYVLNDPTAPTVLLRPSEFARLRENDPDSARLDEWIEIDLLQHEEAVPDYWLLIGERLRHADNGSDVNRSAADLPRWEELNAAHMLDWWPLVPRWRDEVRATFQRWEKGDPAFVALWRETREWSLADFRRIFAELGATFDVWFFESEMEEPGRAIVQELLAQGVAEYSRLPEHDQAPLPVVKIDEKLGLTEPTYRTMPILRSDGTTLYSTKDLALTKIKFEEFGVDRAIWVVDVRQSLYFQQIFKIMELWGFAQARNAYHLAYDMVVLPEGVISSRRGNVPVYDDVRDAVLARAREIIEEKNPDLPAERKEEVAWQVALGSLKYAMLARDNPKAITFDLEEALSFDGKTAPYIQYAHARACRILEHAGETDETLRSRLDRLDFGALQPEELSLLQTIAALPEEIQRAAAEYRPLLIASYVYDLAKRFNDFYHECPVLTSPEPTRTARLTLVAATRRTLANGLALLGIAAPEEM